MAKIILRQEAIDDLNNIWEYTFETWSEHQADSYYFALVEDCQKLADHSFLGRNYHEIRYCFLDPASVNLLLIKKTHYEK